MWQTLREKAQTEWKWSERGADKIYLTEGDADLDKVNKGPQIVLFIIANWDIMLASYTIEC